MAQMAQMEKRGLKGIVGAVLVLAIAVCFMDAVDAMDKVDGNGHPRTRTDVMGETTEPLYVVEGQDLSAVMWSGTLRPEGLLVSTAVEGATVESLIPPVEKDEGGGFDWLAIVAAALGLVWSFFKGTTLYKNDRYQKGLDLIAGEVTATYHDYVRAIKAGREDGSLTPEEKKAAMAMTMRGVRERALETGYGLYKAFHCDEVIKAKVEEAISAAKAKAAGTGK